MQMLIKQLKHIKLSNHVVKQAVCLAALFLPLAVVNGCGKRKPPLPPVERVAQRVNISGEQIGNRIDLVWQMPARNAPDGSALNINRADIYRLAEPLSAPLSLTEEEFSAQSTLIASIPIADSDFALKIKNFRDTLQFAGQKARLRYAIRFVNASGQKAAFSNFFLIEPASNIAAQPSDLSAGVSQDAISLAWNAPGSNIDGSTPPNVLGYNLYRRTVGKAPEKQLNDEPIKETEYKDTFFDFETNYEYRVTTVSLGTGGKPVESVGSNSIQILPKDTFAPAPPESITIAAAPNSISIFFATNVEKDIKGYRLYRTTDQTTPKRDWELLTPTLLQINTYQDTKVKSGTKYYYYLTAVDSFGNISGPSVVVSEIAF